MSRYMIRRLLSGVINICAISLVCFIVISLPPGDFGSALEYELIQSGGMSPQEAALAAEQIREKYGLNAPMFVRFVKWFWGVIRGDFGYSLTYRSPVSEVIWPRLGWTLFISVSAWLFSLIVGVSAGVYSATHQYKVGDYLISFASFVGLSIPTFFIALVMVYILIFHVKVSSIGGLFSLRMALAPWSWAKFVDLMQHVWIPIVIVGAAGTARNMRVMRANLLDVLNAEYVKVARSKGLSERTVIWKHALRNAVQPLVMSIGMTLPWLIQGEVATSIVLGLPTTGPMLLRALQTQDMYLAGSFLFLISCLMVLCNLLADLALCLVDPRVRY